MHDHAWDIREGELREKFIRESRCLKKGLEQNKEENVELKKSVKEKKYSNGASKRHLKI